MGHAEEHAGEPGAVAFSIRTPQDAPTRLADLHTHAGMRGTVWHAHGQGPHWHREDGPAEVVDDSAPTWVAGGAPEAVRTVLTAALRVAVQRAAILTDRPGLRAGMPALTVVWDEAAALWGAAAPPGRADLVELAREVVAAGRGVGVRVTPPVDTCTPGVHHGCYHHNAGGTTMTAATAATADLVLPVTDERSWDYGDGRMGLTWAQAPADGGEHYGTSVSLRPVFGGLTEVTREGKGDRLRVDLDAARRGMTPVVWTDHTVVGYLGAPRDLPVQVQTPDQFDAAVRGEAVEWAEYDNVETALVDLAFLHVS